MDILAAVTARLSALNYTVIDADIDAIKYNIAKAEASLKAQTNQVDVPEGLFYVLVDMAAGMFLLDKKATGALGSSSDYNFAAPAKSISEGDTSVTFAIADTGSAEDQFDAMLDRMVHPSGELIAAYRRLAW